MKSKSLPRFARFFALFTASAYLMSCQGVPTTPTPTSTDPGPTPQINFTGVAMWKGDPSETGLYSSETTLTPANVNVSQFGRLGSFQLDGIVMGQPLYISKLDMGSAGTHDVIFLVTEHDSVYAIDADNPGAGSLWERHYVDPANGVTTTTLGGEIGITGTL